VNLVDNLDYSSAKSELLKLKTFPLET